MSVPVARLTTRLRNEHPLAEAYTIARYAFRDAAFCRTFARQGAPSEPAEQDAAKAVKYFDAAAVAVAGSAVGTNQSSGPPSSQDLDRLRTKVENEFGDCRS